MQLGNLVRRGALAVVIATAAAPLVATAASATGTPPGTPTSVTVASGNRLLGVSWMEASTGRITYTATATSTGHATRRCRTQRLACNITALSNGVTYNVSVVAANASGKSSATTPVPMIVGVPGPPLSVHATAVKGGTADVKWAKPVASGVSAITGYTATANPGALTCSTTAGGRTCVLSGLTKGTKYTISVTATNKYGTGPASKTATITAK